MSTTTGAKTFPLKTIPGQNFNLVNLEKSKVIENASKIYVNAFPITFTKDISIHEYPFEIVPEEKQDFLVAKIFSGISRKILENYGAFYQSGKSFYSLKEVLEPKDFSLEIESNENKTKFEYRIQVSKKTETFMIKKGQTDLFTQIQEKMILLIIREILTTNPTIKVDKDNYIRRKSKGKRISL